MDIDFTILMSFIAFSVGISLMGFWIQKKDEHTIIPALLFFVSGSILMFLFLNTDNVITTYFSSGMTDNLYSYNIESGSSSRAINTGVGSEISGEYVATSSSQLYNKEIDCIDLWVSKAGTPTGTATIGIFNGISTVEADQLIKQFGLQDVGILTGQAQVKTYCLTNGETYTTGINDVVGAMFRGGSVGNSFNIRIDTSNNPFDGTNTFERRWDDVTQAWISATTTDLGARFYLSGSELEITSNAIDFSEFKYYFLVVSSFMLLIGAYSVKIYKGQGSGEFIDSL